MSGSFSPCGKPYFYLNIVPDGNLIVGLPIPVSNKINYKLSLLNLSLPDPASVVPKPEVQHLVPWVNRWPEVGRQAG